MRYLQEILFNGLTQFQIAEVDVDGADIVWAQLRVGPVHLVHVGHARGEDVQLRQSLKNQNWMI